MTTSEKLARAMAIVEVAVQHMAEEGIEPVERAVSLSAHLKRQADIAMPTEEAAEAFLESLMERGYL